MSRSFASALVLVLASGVTSAADAKEFRGKTRQGRPVSVVVGTDGLVRTARIAWRARCRHGRVRTATRFVSPLDAATRNAFQDTGVYRKRQGGGYRLRFSPHIRGRRVFDPSRPEAERWRGTFSARVLVTRRGRHVDTCRIAGLRWSARLVR
jgi:hypothetical protein